MALGFMGTGGSQLVSQINFRIGTKGVVTGANIMKMQLNNIDKTARRTALRLGEVEEKAQSVSKTMTQASAALAGVGFGLLSIGKKISTSFVQPAIQGASDFEVAMGRIQFATGATGKELQKLEDFMIDLGLKTKETPVSAAHAFADLRSAGMDTAESMELLPMVIQMVTGSRGMLGMDEAIRTTIGAISKFRHLGQPFAKTLDDIAQATRVTALNWQHMPAFINALRDAPKKLKATTSEMLAIGGAMRMGSMQAAESAQAIALFAEKMISNQRKLGAYMEKKGITEEQFFQMDPKDLPKRMIQFQKFGVSMFDAAGKTRPLKDVLVETLEKMQSLGKESDRAQATVMSGAFGSKGTTVLSMLEQLTKQGESFREMVNRLSGDVDNSNGILKQAEEAYLRTTEGLKELKKGTEQTILIIMGKAMLPVFYDVIAVLKFFLDGFLSYLKKNPAVAKALSWTITLLGGLATVLGTVLIGLAAFLMYQGMVVPAVNAAGGSIAFLTKAFAALRTNILRVLIAAGAVVAIFLLLYLVIKNWSHIRKYFGPVIDAFVQRLKDLWLIAQGVVEWFNGGEGSIDLYRMLEKRQLLGIVGFIIQVKERLVAVFEGFFTVIGGVFKLAFRIFYGVIWVTGKLLDALGLLPQAFGTSDITNALSVYRAVGAIFGVLALLVGGLLVNQFLTGASAVAKLTQMIWALGSAATVAQLKIAAVGIIFLVLLAIALRVGPKVGNAFANMMETITYWFNYFVVLFETHGFDAFKKIGEGMVQWIRQGFTNGWEGFKKWFFAQIDFLVVKGMSLFGLKSEEEVNDAWKKATEGVTVDMGVSEKAVEDRVLGSEYVSRREAQRARIAELAANSRNFPITRQREGWETSGGPGGAQQSVMAPVAEAGPKVGKIEVIIQGNATKEDAMAIAKQTGDRMQQFWDYQQGIAFK